MHKILTVLKISHRLITSACKNKIAHYFLKIIQNILTGLVARSVACPLRKQSFRDQPSRPAYSFVETKSPLPLFQEQQVIS